MKCRYELAGPTDDAALREMLRELPVPGAIEVTYRREPDYFLGCASHGSFCQVVVARHQDRVAALACRAARRRFVDGRPQTVGYLGQLRVLPRYRSLSVLVDGFRYFRELHGDGRTGFYLTTIIEGNHRAEQLLVHKSRPSLPLYRPWGRLYTLALFSRRQTRWADGVRSAQATEATQLAKFLNRHGSSRQFSLAWQSEDFDGHLGPRPQDFLILEGEHGWQGVVAVWDQSCKQTVVESYPRSWGWSRSLVNGVLGGQTLPPTGQELPMAYLTGLSLCDPNAFKPLISSALARARQLGKGFLMLGLHEDDPLLQQARSFLHLPYISRIYTVHFDAQKGRSDAQKGGFDAARVPYLEIATL